MNYDRVDADYRTKVAAFAKKMLALEEGAPTEGYVRFYSGAKWRTRSKRRDNLQFFVGRTTHDELIKDITRHVLELADEPGKIWVEGLLEGDTTAREGFNVLATGDPDDDQEDETAALVRKEGALAAALSTVAVQQMRLLERAQQKIVDLASEGAADQVRLGWLGGEMKALIEHRDDESAAKIAEVVVPEISKLIMMWMGQHGGRVPESAANSGGGEDLGAQPEGASAERIAWDLEVMERAAKDIVTTFGQSPASLTTELLERLKRLLAASQQAVTFAESAMGGAK